MSSIIIHNFSSANCDDFNIRIEKKINKQTKKKKMKTSTYRDKLCDRENSAASRQIRKSQPTAIEDLPPTLHTIHNTPHTTAAITNSKY